MTEDQERSQGSIRHLAKKALAPIVASAATAITAYLMRKAAEIWQQRVEPELEKRGGGKAVATDAFESVRERIPDSASEKLEELSSKVSGEDESAPSATAGATPDSERTEERRKREQRRKQRRKTLEQAGSS